MVNVLLCGYTIHACDKINIDRDFDFDAFRPEIN